MDITSDGVVYATLSSDGTGKGIWRSADGMEWTNIIPDGFGNVYGRTAIGINPSNENEVYFLTAETENSGQYTNTFLEEKPGHPYGNIPTCVVMVMTVVETG